jgi:hypothetical protein
MYGKAPPNITVYLSTWQKAEEMYLTPMVYNYCPYIICVYQVVA